MPNQHVTDDDREKLAAALALALREIYMGRKTQAFEQLNAVERGLHLTAAAMQKLNAEAEKVAQSVQSGVNERILAAQSPDNPQTVSEAKAGMDDYNDKTLVPYLVSYAAMQGLLDAYSEVPSGDVQGQSMLDVTQWVWERLSGAGYEDNCQDAVDASPASYGELTDIAGGEPPIHRNCACQISPA